MRRWQGHRVNSATNFATNPFDVHVAAVAYEPLSRLHRQASAFDPPHAVHRTAHPHSSLHGVRIATVSPLQREDASPLSEHQGSPWSQEQSTSDNDDISKLHAHRSRPASCTQGSVEFGSMEPPHEIQALCLVVDGQGYQRPSGWALCRCHRRSLFSDVVQGLPM
jgi:hypothetical protein